MSLERQASDCVIDGDQDTPLLQADQDEDDEVMLDIRPTVSQHIVNHRFRETKIYSKKL